LSTGDQDLRFIRRILSGDAPSFDEFFDRYFPALYRFALARLGGDADSAEEVVQETLCRAIPKLHTFRGDAALFTWLCTFCRHEISALLHRQRRAGSQVPLIEEAPEVRAALESLAAIVEDDAEASARRAEVRRLVRLVLDHLPGRYGSALEWKYIDGLPVREIAARLKLSEKAAESLLTRARNAFRDEFLALTTTATPLRPNPVTP